MFSILLVLSREWMGLGVAGMIITTSCMAHPRQSVQLDVKPGAWIPRRHQLSRLRRAAQPVVPGADGRASAKAGTALWCHGMLGVCKVKTQEKWWILAEIRQEMIGF